MTQWQDLVRTPTLILDEARVRANIGRMAGKARRNQAKLRPHFKTHQSAEIGEWFRDEGVEAITVSSLEMAAYFADSGWEDILVAFPANWREVGRINELACRVRLGLLVESVETAEMLAGELTSPVSVWLKIDAGYGRTGIAWDQPADAAAVAAVVAKAPQLRLTGILTHAGHTYQASTPDEVERLYLESAGRMWTAKQALASAGFDDLQISVGDTPGCSVATELGPVDEIRAGNFVFYDLMQLSLEACGEEDIAVALACPMVARHPGRGQVVVYGGAIHLSLAQVVGANGRRQFGLVAEPTQDGWLPADPDSFVASVSQEHGLVQASTSLMRRVSVGELLMVLPAHSCLTANLMGRYLTTTGRWITSMRTLK